MSRQATIFGTTYEICGYQPNHAEPLTNPPKVTRRKERRNEVGFIIYQFVLGFNDFEWKENDRSAKNATEN